MRKLLTLSALLLLANVQSLDAQKIPKPRFVEDKVPGHPELTGHHWTCGKGWEVTGEKPPFSCRKAKPVDPYAVRTVSTK